MSVAMQHEQDNVYRVEMSGRLQRADFERCEAALADEMRRVGHVKLLFVLENFEGWGPGSGWNDLSFYVQHGDAIDRIAIVGDPRWQAEALMFAAAGLRRAPVEFFDNADLAAARSWLSA